MAFSKDADQALCAGVDNSVRVIDLKSNKVDFSLVGHSDTITSLSLSKSGSHLLTNSMDNSLIMWDVRPFVQGNQREVRRFHGHSHNFEKNLIGCDWSQDDKLVAVGSADRFVYVWNSQNGKLEHQLGGHKGQVNDVKFRPQETYEIASASSDKTIFIGQLR